MSVFLQICDLIKNFFCYSDVEVQFYDPWNQEHSDEYPPEPETSPSPILPP